jgi:hypothetical protein
MGKPSKTNLVGQSVMHPHQGFTRKQMAMAFVQIMANIAYKDKGVLL